MFIDSPDAVLIFDQLYEVPAGNRIGSICANPAIVNVVAHVVVANHAFPDLVALAAKGWRLYREAPPILDCFHGHFCLGAAVVDPRHGDYRQPSVTSVYFELA